MSPLTFSAIRHRLLLSLALAQCPVTLRQLARETERCPTTIYGHLRRLLAAGLVEQPGRGLDTYRLRPGVVVSEKGHVGYLVPLDLTPKPCVQFNGETERHYDFAWEAGRVVTLESGR